MIGLPERIRRHDWFAVFVELLVVIVGILLALQVGQWAQGREERRLERVYLQRLKEDLTIERSEMDAAEHFANARIEAARLLGRLTEEPSLAAEQPARMPWAVETASWRSFPKINAYVYHELQSTGRFALIRSEKLRRKLAEHYAAFEHDARVGEDLSAQKRFDAATAGLLSIDELDAVERATGDFHQLRMTPERATDVARAFIARPAAIAELPGLVQHHTFNLRVISQMRSRANQIIQQIDSLD